MASCIAVKGARTVRSMSQKTARSGDVQSVQRALELLELVARAGEIGVSELAREAGLAVSTTHSLVRTLARRHYLIGVGGRYRVGPAATVLSSAWDPTGSLGSIVAPIMDDLSARAGHASTATVLVGRDARIIGFAPAPGPVTATTGGLRWSDPLGLATGRLLVACAHEAEWEAILDRSQDTEPSWSRRRWLNELRAIQRSGIALKTSRDRRGVSGLAVPVWSRGDIVVASIGCFAPTFLLSDLTNEQTVDALWDASIALSRELGCDEPPLPRPREALVTPRANVS